MLAAVVGALCAGPAFADDNGMTAHYGDSWADLQAHDPAASPVPALAAQESAPDARDTWANTRERARETAHRWRDKTSAAMHGMTRSTATSSDNAEAAPTQGSTSTEYGSAGSVSGDAAADAAAEPATGSKITGGDVNTAPTDAHSDRSTSSRTRVDANGNVVVAPEDARSSGGGSLGSGASSPGGANTMRH
jgi:hypothetical protein